jgi:hypothetical protein
MAIILKDFGPYGIIFKTVFATLDFRTILEGQFTSVFLLAYFQKTNMCLSNHQPVCLRVCVCVYVCVCVSVCVSLTNNF